MVLRTDFTDTTVAAGNHAALHNDTSTDVNTLSAWLGGTRHQVNVYVSNATWTKPAGAKFVWVRLVGGGGAGGGAVTTAANESAVGGGGGGGGYCEKWWDAASLSATQAVVVGQGGTGVAGAAGNDGTASTFSTMSAGGGIAGTITAASSTALSVATGGDGGPSSGGDINATGFPGEMGLRYPSLRDGAGTGTINAFARGGMGGGSVFGGNARTGNTSNNSGFAGESYGGGGSGGQNNASQVTTRTGGSGVVGIVIVITFF